MYNVDVAFVHVFVCLCVCLGSCIGRMFVSTVFLVPADARRRGQAARVRTGQSEWVGTPVTDHHVAGNF